MCGLMLRISGRIQFFVLQSGRRGSLSACPTLDGTMSSYLDCRNGTSLVKIHFSANSFDHR